MRHVFTAQWAPRLAPMSAHPLRAAALARHRPSLTRYATWLFGFVAPARALVDDVLDDAASDVAFAPDGAIRRADLFERFKRRAVARLRDRARVAPLRDDSDEPGADGEPLFHADGRWCDRPAALREGDDDPRSASLQTVLERGIDALPRHTACVFVLREVFGLTARQIAAVSGLPLFTCRTMLSRARLRVYQRLQREWAAPRHLS